MSKIWFVIILLLCVFTIFIRVFKSILRSTEADSYILRRYAMLYMPLFALCSIILLGVSALHSVEKQDVILLLFILLSFFVFVFELSCFFSCTNTDTNNFSFLGSLFLWTFSIVLCIKYHSTIFNQDFLILLSVLTNAVTSSIIEILNIARKINNKRKEKYPYLNYQRYR